MKNDVGNDILRTQQSSWKSVDKNGLLLSSRSITKNGNEIQHYKGDQIRIDLKQCKTRSMRIVCSL